MSHSEKERNISFVCHTKANIVRHNLFKGKSYSPTATPEGNMFFRGWIDLHRAISCLLHRNNASSNLIQKKISYCFTYVQDHVIYHEIIYLYYYQKLSFEPYNFYWIKLAISERVGCNAREGDMNVCRIDTWRVTPNQSKRCM